MKTLIVRVSNDLDEVEELVGRGYCPVECSIGGKSVVDDLLMDHHGEWSHLESVAVRGYRDHYGARAHDPRFVVAGVADADATFAIAALAGVLPHPNKEVSGPPPVVKAQTQDLAGLAETVAVIDTDPIGRHLPEMEGGDILLAWNAMSDGRTDLGATTGVGLWVSLTTGNPTQQRPLLDGAVAAETRRRELAANELFEVGDTVDGVTILDGSTVFGFDVWYGRLSDADADTAAGWARPVVLARVAKTGGITIGCPNAEVAEALFGPGGLKNVFSLLQPEGWGGRETVGGSPRGTQMSAAELRAAARVVAEARRT